MRDATRLEAVVAWASGWAPKEDHALFIVSKSRLCGYRTNLRSRSPPATQREQRRRVAKSKTILAVVARRRSSFRGAGKMAQSV
jgi:hypothetical protein